MNGRTGKISRSAAVSLVATVGLLALLTLSACVSSPRPTATPTANATTRAPEPTVAVDPLTTVTQLVARPTALELRAADGSVVMSLDYMGSAADAVSTLSTVFGGAPVDKPYEGTNHVPPGINHVWDYMTLDERHYDEAMRQDKGINDIVWPRYAIYFDAPEVRGISLSTVQGFAAGDSWSTIQGGPGIGIVGCNGVSAETTVYPAVHEGRDVSVTAGVAFRLDDAQQSVRWIAAPEDFDPGCP